jgi:hypothetical protein
MATPFNASDFIADIYKAETAMTIPGRDCRIRAVYGIKFSGFNAFMITDPLGVDGLAGAVESVPLDPLPLEGEAPHADFICPEAPFEAPATEALDKESAPFAYWGVKPMLKVGKYLRFYVGDAGPFTQYPVKAGSPVRLESTYSGTDMDRDCFVYRTDDGPWRIHDGNAFKMPAAESPDKTGNCVLQWDYIYGSGRNRMRWLDEALVRYCAGAPTLYFGFEVEIFFNAPSEAGLSNWLNQWTGLLRAPLPSCAGLNPSEYTATRASGAVVKAAWTAAQEKYNIGGLMSYIEFSHERSIPIRPEVLAATAEVAASLRAARESDPPRVNGAEALIYRALVKRATFAAAPVVVSSNTAMLISTHPPGLPIKVRYGEQAGAICPGVGVESSSQTVFPPHGGAMGVKCYIDDQASEYAGIGNFAQWNRIPTTIDYSDPTVFHISGGLVTGASVPSANTSSLGLAIPASVPSTVPEDPDIVITGVADRAFLSCAHITSAHLAEGIESIGGQAFSGCASLTSVTIPSTVTTIGAEAFYGCTALTSVTIPEGVTSIGAETFYGCASLTSIVIPPTVTSIGYQAFSGCASLTSIVIPPTVTSIGYRAFSGCASLTSIVIPPTVTSMGEGAFGACTALTSVTIPEGVTSIVEEMFFSCSSLVSVTIPSTVTTIGAEAFSGCASLTSIVIPPTVTSVEAYAFINCSSLASVTIPEGVTSIGAGTFYGCSALASVTIPSTVTTIGAKVFHGCHVLTEVRFDGSTPPSIPADAFSGAGAGWLAASYPPGGSSSDWPTVWGGALTARRTS